MPCRSAVSVYDRLVGLRDRTCSATRCGPQAADQVGRSDQADRPGQRSIIPIGAGM